LGAREGLLHKIFRVLSHIIIHSRTLKIHAGAVKRRSGVSATSFETGAARLPQDEACRFAKGLILRSAKRVSKDAGQKVT